MACGPFANHIVHDHALVLMGGVDRDTGGAADVEAVHERVAGEDDVEQVSERPLLLRAANRLGARHGAVADERGHPATAAGGLRAGGLHRGDDARRTQAGVLGHLQPCEHIDHDRAGLLRALLGGHLLPGQFGNRGDHLGHAQDVTRHRANVPPRAVSTQSPLAGGDAFQQGPDPGVLGGRSGHGGIPVKHADARSCGGTRSQFRGHGDLLRSGPDAQVVSEHVDGPVQQAAPA